MSGDASSRPDDTGPYEESQTPDEVRIGSLVAGRYELTKQLGEGGMGSVWMAVQIEPVKRHVAVKFIKTGMQSNAVLARFEAERQALALMDHPNIATVLDAGTSGGQPFFVMELVRGRAITEFCDAQRLTPRQRLELFVPVCQAVQHAHQKGVIHRDLKPTNVLVAEHDGKSIPKVIDFGVAKATGAPLTERTLHTRSDAVIGTPLYMSPEQATFNQSDIDTRTDVYSLGVLMYELLTGTTPIERERFRKAALDEMLRVVREEEPPRPSVRLSSTASKASIAAIRGAEPGRLAREFRGELDWIVMKCLEKERARRYDTAAGLALDLQRYLADEVVDARPPSLAYRARKFARRHKASVTATVIVLFALMGGLIGTAYGLFEAGNQRAADALRQQAERDRDLLDIEKKATEQANNGLKTAREKLLRFDYGRTIQIALQAWRDGDVAGARALLASTPPELRGWEWWYVHRLCHPDQLTLPGRGRPPHISSAEFSPDGARVLLSYGDGGAVVADAETGEERVVFRITGEDVIYAAYNQKGDRVVTVARTGDGAAARHLARVWDAATGVRLVPLGEPGRTDPPSVDLNGLRCNTLSPDGRRLVTYHVDEKLRVWDANTGKIQAAIPLARVHSASWVRFTPDGSRLMGQSGDDFCVWDSATGSLRAKIERASASSEASVSADGARVVLQRWVPDYALAVYDTATGAEVSSRKGPETWVVVAISPDGKRVVTRTYVPGLRVWDAASWKPLVTLADDGGARVRFSPDGRRLVTYGFGPNPVRVWDTITGQELAAVKFPNIGEASFSPDGQRVLARSQAEVYVLDARAGAEAVRVEHGNATSAHFDASGGRVVTSSAGDGTARVWDAATGAELARLVHPENRLTNKGVGDWYTIDQGRFVGNGSRVVTNCRDGHLRLWDLAAGAFTLTPAPDVQWGSAKSYAEISSDGSRAATPTQRGSIQVWAVGSSDPPIELKHPTGIYVGVSVSRDGGRVASILADGSEVKIWDARTGTEVLSLSPPLHWPGENEKDQWGQSRQYFGPPALSPDGEQVAIAAGDGAVVRPTRTGAGPVSLQGAPWLRQFVFSPDGSRLAGNAGAILIWDTRTGAELARLSGHPSGVVSVGFSPDGSRIITGDHQGTARVWDAASGAEVLVLRGRVGAEIHAVEFSPDGSRLVMLELYTGGVRVYDATPVNRAFRPSAPSPTSAPVHTRFLPTTPPPQQAWTEAEFRHALELAERSIQQNPSLAMTRLGLAITHRDFGYLLTERGKRAEAMEQFRQELAIAEKLVAENPAVPAFGGEVAWGHYNIACLFATENETDPAKKERNTAKAMEELRKAVAAGFADVEHMIRDKDLDTLRNRPDFRELIASIPKVATRHAPKEIAPLPRERK